MICDVIVHGRTMKDGRQRIDPDILNHLSCKHMLGGLGTRGPFKMVRRSAIIKNG